MSGIKIAVPLSFTGDYARSVTPLGSGGPDPMQTSGLGSMVLFDVNHPLSPLPAGVPASGAVIPNLVAAKAAALLGVSEASTNGSFYSTASMLNSVAGKAERTPKGGIHGIYRQSAAAPVGIYADTTQALSVRLPMAALDAYLRAHPTNDYYVSLWHRITRPTLQTYNAWATMRSGNGFFFRFGGADGNTDPNTPSGLRLGIRNNNPNANSLEMRTIAGSAVPADYIAGTPDAKDMVAWHVGNLIAPNGSVGGGSAGKSGSHVFYRFYMEDLTVSGRTYAQVDALDLAQYTAQVLTTGGRYNGDTVPTDPASIQ